MTTGTLVPFDIEAGPTDRHQCAASRPVGLLDDRAGPFTTMKIVDSCNAALRAARRALDVHEAGILLAVDCGAISAVSSGNRSGRAEALQVEHHQGPGLQAIQSRQPVVSGELRLDGRWRSWAPPAADLGFRSVLSLPLADGNPFGAVTVYSLHASYFGGESSAPGLALARQAAVSIIAAARILPETAVTATTSPRKRHQPGVRS